MISFTECTGNLFSKKKKMFVIRILFITKQKSIQKKKTTAHTKHTYVSNQVLPRSSHLQPCSQCWHHVREKRPLIDFVRSKLLDFMDDAQSLDCNRTDDDDETKQKTLVESKTINVELSVVN